MVNVSTVEGCLAAACALISLKYIHELCASVNQTNVNADDSNPELESKLICFGQIPV